MHCKFARILDQHHTVGSLGDFRKKGVGQRGLASRGTAGDQNVSACGDGAAQGLSLIRGHDAGGNVVVKREHGCCWLADSKGGSRDHRWQEALKTLSGLGQFSGNAGRTSMHFGTDVMRHQPNNAFPVSSREALSRVRQAARQPINPQPAIGVEHHLDDRGVLQISRNGGAERAAEHARAARDRLCLSRMNCHCRPQQRRRLRSALRCG